MSAEISRNAPKCRRGVQWKAAAALVVLLSIGVAMWLDTTAARVDHDTLARRGEGLAAHIEERMRLLSLVTNGTQGLLVNSLDTEDLLDLTGSVSPELIGTASGLVGYPIVGGAIGEGSVIWSFFNYDTEDLPDLTGRGGVLLDEITSSNDAYLSPAHRSPSTGKIAYVLLRPAEAEDGTTSNLVGFLFFADTLLGGSVHSQGRDVLAASLVDVRSGDAVVASAGRAVGDDSLRLHLDPATGAWDLIVRQGPAFSTTRSIWVPTAVIAVGLIIALLLLSMARLARARSEELAERLRLAESLNHNKDQFLASVSHELRTPLTVVLGLAHELTPRWSTIARDERITLLELMTEQAEEASSIVDDLIVAARADTGMLHINIEPTELDTHLRFALDSLPSERRGSVAVRGSVGLLNADPTRLRQILRNLLDNAARYGGPHLEVRATVDHGHAVVIIADDGNPIPHPVMQHLFDPYERAGGAETSPAGVGVGLYVSRLLARLMHGDLVFRRHDGWNEFVLTVPAPERNATGAGATVLDHAS